MLILGISGKKQSGKSTTGNFIYSLHMAEMGISNEVYIDGKGRIVVSDLLGDKNYSGIFDPTKRNKQDYIISKVFDRLDSAIKIYNFADPLKEICIDVLGLTYEQCYGSDEDKNQLVNCYQKGKQITAREVMQILGTDMFRGMQENVWASATVRKIKKEQPSIAVITDSRFPNEIEAVKNAGGKHIRLTRNPHNSTHKSETALDKEYYDWTNFDYVLDNSKMEILEQLEEVKKILGELV